MRAAAAARRSASLWHHWSRPLQTTGRWRGSPDGVGALVVRQLSTSKLQEPRPRSRKVPPDESLSTGSLGPGGGWAEAVYPSHSTLAPNELRDHEHADELDGHDSHRRSVGDQQYQLNGHANGVEHAGSLQAGDSLRRRSEEDLLFGHGSEEAWLPPPPLAFDVHGRPVQHILTNGVMPTGMGWAEAKRLHYGETHDGRGYADMSAAEKLQWEQEINELQACDAAIEELLGRWCPRDRWAGMQEALHPSKLRAEDAPQERGEMGVEGAPQERGEMGVAQQEREWRPPTKMEYLGTKQAQRFLGEQQWFMQLQDAILPELRAAAKAGGAEDDDAMRSHRLEITGDGMTQKALRALVQPPPRRVRSRSTLPPPPHRPTHQPPHLATAPPRPARPARPAAPAAAAALAAGWACCTPLTSLAPASLAPTSLALTSPRWHPHRVPTLAAGGAPAARDAQEERQRGALAGGGAAGAEHTRRTARGPAGPLQQGGAGAEARVPTEALRTA